MVATSRERLDVFQCGDENWARLEIFFAGLGGCGCTFSREAKSSIISLQMSVRALQAEKLHLLGIGPIQIRFLQQ